MKKVLLIGCGNPLRADDGIGPHAVRRMAATSTLATLAGLTPHQLTPDLAEPIQAARRVIFIDASIQDPPGTIRIRPLVAATTPPRVLAHWLSPSSLLGLTNQLYGICPPAVLVSMGARSFGFGEPFSPEVAHAFPALITCLERLVAPQTPSSESTRLWDARPGSA